MNEKHPIDELNEKISSQSKSIEGLFICLIAAFFLVVGLLLSICVVKRENSALINKNTQLEGVISAYKYQLSNEPQ